MGRMEALISFGAVALIILLTPLLGWLLQGVKTKRGGVASAMMDGVGAVYETQQTRIREAHNEKQKGSRENGDPPSIS